MNIDKWDEYGLECDQHLYPELGAAFDVELADLLPVQAPCGAQPVHSHQHHQYAQLKLRQAPFIQQLQSQSSPLHQVQQVHATHNSQRMFEQESSPPRRELEPANQLSDENYDSMGRSDPLLFDSSLLQQHQFQLQNSLYEASDGATPAWATSFTSQLEGVEVPLGERLAELSKPDACDISVQLEYDYPPDYAPLDDHPHQSCVPIQEDPDAELELIPVPAHDPSDPDWEDTGREHRGSGYGNSSGMDWDWSSNSMSDDSESQLSDNDFGTSSNKSAQKGNRRPRLANRSRQRIAANKRERSRMKVINRGFEKLRKVVPYARNDRRHSKVETLRLAIDYIRNLDALLNRDAKYDTGASSSDLAEQQSVIVYYTPVGEEPSAAVAHSLSWVKEPQMTGSCFPNIVPNDRNGIIQTQRIRARVWYPALSERDSNTKGSVPVDLLPRPAPASNTSLRH